ncbi:hypothetical protein G7B40_032400 [Aetokthonos hydrillicola Thurmond2011]|jgi:hypothetical protein|uniref:Uncharacterized protein n=1 Tax=Aetokthonos hydrillicola Thurmond2011 TaxID=2712845 RepID=A0AAP5M8J5_9CYAN|nr:hypothetical protein [Aetokthonos hydrillicola]MBO3464484.1 hypothetical protein [Aetokthonos hydrillicola CCALA 1050]MBW4585721.1 hypothetical protein [Aetokthonos hydrillicola CCALA 1050]MDR9899226.1 hypothetical protein [Aetokthonos hydrillicola Thurmond2011]
MDSLNIRAKVFTEISLVPEEKLEELYNFIHYFRLGVEVCGVEVSKETLNPSMDFAGCWNDMSEEMFANFYEEIRTRRQQAFSGRRSDETSFD